MLRLTHVQGNRQAPCGRIVSCSGAFSLCVLHARRPIPVSGWASSIGKISVIWPMPGWHVCDVPFCRMNRYMERFSLPHTQPFARQIACRIRTFGITLLFHFCRITHTASANLEREKRVYWQLHELDSFNTIWSSVYSDVVGSKYINRFERSNRLCNALYKNIIIPLHLFTFQNVRCNQHSPAIYTMAW